MWSFNNEREKKEGKNNHHGLVAPCRTDHSQSAIEVDDCNLSASETICPFHGPCWRSSPVVFGLIPWWGLADTEMKEPAAENPVTLGSFKPRVLQNIALHAFPTARNSF